MCNFNGWPTSWFTWQNEQKRFVAHMCNNTLRWFLWCSRNEETTLTRNCSCLAGTTSHRPSTLWAAPNPIVCHKNLRVHTEKLFRILAVGHDHGLDEKYFSVNWTSNMVKTNCRQRLRRACLVNLTRMDFPLDWLASSTNVIHATLIKCIISCGADRIQKNVAVIEPVYHHLQLAWHATQEIAWWDPRGLCFRLAKFQGTCVYASTHFTNAVIHSQVKTASFSGVREAGCHYELQCALFPTWAAVVLPFFTEDSLDYVRHHKRFNFDRIKSTRVLSQTLAACNSTLMWQKIRIEWNPKHKVPDSKETNRKRNHDSQSVQPSPHFLKMSSIHASRHPWWILLAVHDTHAFIT